MYNKGLYYGIPQDKLRAIIFWLYTEYNNCDCYCHCERSVNSHLTLLRCVFLRESRVVSSDISGSKFPLLELPVHWPAAMSRRQLKNDDRCPQNNLTLLQRKNTVLIGSHISALELRIIFSTFSSVHISICDTLS
jgi:hypothetical protein